MTYDEMYDILTEMEIATEKEIRLVTSIMGSRAEVLESILFSRTGWNSFDGFLEELNEEYD